jgi:hypothetical protein
MGAGTLPVERVKVNPHFVLSSSAGIDRPEARCSTGRGKKAQFHTEARIDEPDRRSG